MTTVIYGGTDTIWLHLKTASLWFLSRNVTQQSVTKLSSMQVLLGFDQKIPLVSDEGGGITREQPLHRKDHKVSSSGGLENKVMLYFTA